MPTSAALSNRSTGVHDVRLVDFPAARPDLADRELTGQAHDRALLVGERPGLSSRG